MQRIALYARCSTADQRPDIQLDRLREYARARELTALEFVDSGIGGAKRRRPALDQLLEFEGVRSMLWLYSSSTGWREVCAT